MKEKVIDFAVWHSGMSREKVLKAYHRYLKEKREGAETKSSDLICQHKNQKVLISCVFCSDCKEFLGGAA